MIMTSKNSQENIFSMTTITIAKELHNENYPLNRFIALKTGIKQNNGQTAKNLETSPIITNKVENANKPAFLQEKGDSGLVLLYSLQKPDEAGTLEQLATKSKD